ncbi:MAG: hypothetical protein ACKV2U_05145 [Bryobacteraceae bacterium]
MNENIQAALENLRSENKERQDKSFIYFIAETAQPVDWAYDVWDEMAATLQDKDNRRRAIAAQVLCNLAKSDPKGRMHGDLAALLAVTKDERFVTARHCLQSLWKIGVADKELRKKLVEGLARRFEECIVEKNCTLIRYDIVVVLGKLYDEVKDEMIRRTALALIEAEEDVKYRKKYASVWKKK